MCSDDNLDRLPELVNRHRLSICYSARFESAEIQSSGDGVGDSNQFRSPNLTPESAVDHKCFGYNTMAESVNGLDKTGVICRSGPKKILETPPIAILEWVDGFSSPRLLKVTEYIT